MTPTSLSGIPMVEEEAADGMVADIYEDVRRFLQVPVIGNMTKAIAVAPGALATHWAFVKSFYEHVTLPVPLSTMILYTIAETKHCQYCSAAHQVTCRTLGIDEEMLAALVEDLGSVTPERIQEIIRFAVKCATEPLSLEPEDYERVREQGVTDEELVEIILVASAANYLDTMADALKIKVDPHISQALQG